MESNTARVVRYFLSPENHVNTQYDQHSIKAGTINRIID